MAQEITWKSHGKTVSTNKILIISMPIDTLTQKERKVIGSHLWSRKYRQLMTTERGSLNLARDEHPGRLSNAK